MKIVFLDVETTGLDPATDKLLEVAAAVVNAQLEPVDGFTSVICPSAPLPPLDPYVQDMHTRNGLLAELPGAPSLSQVGKALCDWLCKHADGAKGVLTLAGNSVHFDLAFLRAQLPLSVIYFSHRLLDVSAFRVGREAVQLEKCPMIAASNHRAQGDVLASIAQARWYLSRMVP